MDICPVKLTPEIMDSLILIETDLPVPSNFTQVINYYGEKDWIGLWVDVPKRLTVYDGHAPSPEGDGLKSKVKSQKSKVKFLTAPISVFKDGACVEKLWSKYSDNPTTGMA